MIDFNALVLSSCQDTFARPIVVTPTKSQLSAAAYAARGIWTEKPVEVGMEDQAVMISQDLTLGLRRAEFPIMLQQGDTIEIPAAGSMPRIGVCAIDKINTDGQGDVELILKIIGA
jgi:small ligand-binding sensory domain FIST